jgi:predicted dehydrogenase
VSSANHRLRVAVIGCGLIGKRRAREVTAHPQTTLAWAIDLDPVVAAEVAAMAGAKSGTDWTEAIADSSVDVVVVATPNGLLSQIAASSLRAGKHVLLEKPMGRNLREALEIRDAAAAAGKVVKVGFNHRFHPAISEAHRRFSAGEIGALINIRARYGHGGRPGYEKEWRGNAELAGGGELTDQGVHILDLAYWFAGQATEIFCRTQSAVWPIEPLEDNGFAILTYPGVIVSFHTSWTQWRNVFSFEVFGTLGSLSVEGLGKSYGEEKLTQAVRKPEGGPPELEEIVYADDDRSWKREWQDFVGAILDNKPYFGTPDDGVAVMRMLDACYRSAASAAAARVQEDA